MDPLSQASFGASLSQSFAHDKKKQFSAMVIGALAGMTPDLDILIRSDVDPMLFLEFHRQFTHSLIFIPIGALICALIFYSVMQSRLFSSTLSFKQVYLFSFLGYATHGLLDACTSYGTQLLWPFSNTRYAWNTVSIIDPFFTLPILILCVFAVAKRNARYAQGAFVYAVIFLAAGLIQKHRAQEALYDLVAQRGHSVERMQVKPSFANRHLWKTIYEYNGRYYVDAVKLVFDVEYFDGSSIPKLDMQRDFPWLPAQSQQARDIERFRWFSDGFIAVSPNDPNLVIDMRYSFVPTEIKPMWGVEVNKLSIDEGDYESHVFYQMFNRLDEDTSNRFYEMLF